jgi:hypothetical protein
MCQPRKFLRRFVMAFGLSCLLLSSSGCSGTLIGGFATDMLDFAAFWQTTPPIPVSAYFSQLVEDTYWEEERYGKVPILDPVEGEHAPLFCLDPPSPDEVMRALPDDVGGGIFFLSETSRNNVRIVTDLMVDRIDECRFYPLAGPARLHHCHYKCTVYYEKVIRSDWPIPFSHKDQKQEVVYIDHDHLIRCAGPPTPR